MIHKLKIVLLLKIFSLPVLNQNGDALLSRSEIFTNLKNLIQNTKSTDNDGLGILTSENRDTWADAYEILTKGSLSQPSSYSFQFL